MKKITLALAMTLACTSAYAAPNPDRPSTLPEDTAVCFGGGALIGAVASGIAVAPALVAVGLCGIIVAEVQYRIDNPGAVPSGTGCFRPIPNTNAFQGSGDC